MIGKVMIRSSFSNVVKYVLDKQKDAKIISAEGVLTDDSKTIIRSFNAQASMRPYLTKHVGHIALSFSPEDKARCTDDFMNRVAQDYLKRMGISNTQFIVVRHFDHKHPHMHIVYNRVNNDGKTISDKNQKIKNQKVCMQLTKWYGLHIAKGKEHVNRNRLRQPAKSKYAIYDAITSILPTSYTWKRFCDALAENNISVELVNKGDTDEIQGVVFILDGYRFTGSKIDRRYSYSKLIKQIKENYEQKKKEVAKERRNRASTTRQSPQHSHHPISTPKSLLKKTLSSKTGAGYSRNAENEVGSGDNGYDDEEHLKRKSSFSY